MKSYFKNSQLAFPSRFPNLENNKIIHLFSRVLKSRGTICIVCNVLHVWSRGQKNEQKNRTMFPALKSIAAAGYRWFALPPCWWIKQKKICSQRLHKNGSELPKEKNFIVPGHQLLFGRNEGGSGKISGDLKDVAENHYDICCYMLTYDVRWLTGATFADSRDSVHLVRKYTTVFFLLAAFTEGNSR